MTTPASASLINKHWIAYYDGDCRFCQRALRWFINICQLPGIFNPIPAQTDDQILLEMNQHQSWILVKPDATHEYGFKAFVSALGLSPRFGRLQPILQLWPIQLLGEVGYRFVARNRVVISTIIGTNR